MFFDFLAFYGLKFYLWQHKDENLKDKKVLFDRDKESMMVVGPDDEVDAHLDHVFSLDDGTSEKTEEEEEFEVMGGGDAVLAAVIAAWLGWETLIVALIIGFMAGAVMGSCYLAHEMYLQKTIKKCLVPCLTYMAIGIILIEGYLQFINAVTVYTKPELVHYLAYGAIGGVCGGVIGVLRSGSHISKPFPFGPALAVGAAVAMFMAKYTFIFGGS
jgi:prepilin signal peptidase PulO-like enzyme (type II secretory pathway)